MNEVEQVLTFWFGPDSDDPQRIRELSQRWFASDPAFDEQIRERFGALWRKASAGELDHWAETARGRLALILLLDQFSRNIARGTAQAFAQDDMAVRMTLEGLDAGHDVELSPPERAFLLMPLQHAEDPLLQERSVVEFRRLLDSSPTAWRKMLSENLAFAEEHRDIVRRFGRFPHRNQVLGRESNKAEKAFLQAGGPRWGQ